MSTNPAWKGPQQWFTEVVPGVFIGHTCVYIADEKGEIVQWDVNEVVEDPEVFGAVLSAVALAAKEGPEAVRDNISSKGERLRELIEKTLLGIK